MKMKRIDFMYGVITLTAFLLLPIYLKIYGYLDQPTFISDIHKNSFYENSMEAILVYSHYKYFVFAIYGILLIMCLSLILSSFMNRIARYQIQCYRLYFPYQKYKILSKKYKILSNPICCEFAVRRQSWNSVSISARSIFGWNW